MDNDLGRIHDTEGDGALQAAHEQLALELNAREAGTPEQLTLELNAWEAGTPGRQASELNARVSTPEQLEALERTIAEQAARASAQQLRRQLQAALDRAAAARTRSRRASTS